MADSVRIIKIKFHYKGFDALRKSPEVRGALAQRANAIASAAGGYPDFDTEVEDNRSRARAVVKTATIEGMLAEQNDRALTRALGAGRG